MFYSILALLLASRATAQTHAQIQTCSQSLDQSNYMSPVTYSTLDDTYHYNATWTYSVSACTSPTRVPINRIFLTNSDAGVSVTCDLHQFDSTGVFNSLCQTETLGAMARISQQYPDSYCESINPQSQENMLMSRDSRCQRRCQTYSIRYPKRLSNRGRTCSIGSCVSSKET